VASTEALSRHRLPSDAGQYDLGEKRACDRTPYFESGCFKGGDGEGFARRRIDDNSMGHCPLRTSGIPLELRSMSRETDFLLAVLRGSTPSEVSDSINWADLLLLAESHGVFPAFCRGYSGDLPETFRERLRTHWATSAYFTSELYRLLQLLSRNGIEALPLKGPVLAEFLYGSISLRTCDDIDLLVNLADFARAQSLLIEAGFAPVDETGNYHRGFLGRDMLVELHFSVASPSLPRFDIERAWARSKRINFCGHDTRIFDKTDLLLYLVLHGVKHHFARLVWLLDVTRALANLDDDDVGQLLEMARWTGIEGALLTTFALAHLVFGSEISPKIGEAIALNPTAFPQAALIADKMLSGPAETGTPAHNASIFVSLETGARRRWAHRLRFLLPTQQDLLWTRQYGIPTVWMRYLRPFRLLFRYGPVVTLRTIFPGLAHRTDTGIRKV
jgi:hypothetical protein